MLLITLALAVAWGVLLRNQFNEAVTERSPPSVESVKSGTDLSGDVGSLAGAFVNGKPEISSSEKEGSDNVFNDLRTADFKYRTLGLYEPDRDLYSLALSLLGPALEGDAESQLAIGKILFRCQSFVSQSSMAGKPRAENRGVVSPDHVPLVTPDQKYETRRRQCAGFSAEQAKQFGRFDDWLNAAAADGSAAAGYWRARQSLNWETGNPVPVEKVSPLINSLISKHPDIYFQIALEHAGLDRSNLENPTTLAWMILACRNGAEDCSTQADWYIDYCQSRFHCGQTSVLSNLSSAVPPYVWAEAETKAEQLLADVQFGTIDLSKLFP